MFITVISEHVQKVHFFFWDLRVTVDMDIEISKKKSKGIIYQLLTYMLYFTYILCTIKLTIKNKFPIS